MYHRHALMQLFFVLSLTLFGRAERDMMSHNNNSTSAFRTTA